MGRWSKRGSAWSQEALLAERPAPPPMAPPRQKEAPVLAGCLRLAAVHPRVAWVRRVNVGGVKFKGQFVKFGWVGAADITGQMRDGRRLEIECKRPGGEPTKAQLAFLTLVKAHGGVAVVVDSVDALARFLNDA